MVNPWENVAKGGERRFYREIVQSCGEMFTDYFAIFQGEVLPIIKILFFELLSLLNGI